MKQNDYILNFKWWPLKHFSEPKCFSLFIARIWFSVEQCGPWVSCFFNFCFHFSFFKKTGTLCLHCLLSLGLNRRGWHWRRWWYFQPPKPGRVHQICQKPHGGQGCILCDGWWSKCSYIGYTETQICNYLPKQLSDWVWQVRYKCDSMWSTSTCGLGLGRYTYCHIYMYHNICITVRYVSWYKLCFSHININGFQIKLKQSLHTSAIYDLSNCKTQKNDSLELTLRKELNPIG